MKERQLLQFVYHDVISFPRSNFVAPGILIGISNTSQSCIVVQIKRIFQRIIQKNN